MSARLGTAPLEMKRASVVGSGEVELTFTGPCLMMAAGPAAADPIWLWGRIVCAWAALLVEESYWRSTEWCGFGRKK